MAVSFACLLSACDLWNNSNDPALIGKTFFPIDGEIYVFLSDEVVINTKHYPYTADGFVLEIPGRGIAYPYSIDGDTLTITTNAGETTVDCLPYDNVRKTLSFRNVPKDTAYSVAICVGFPYEDMFIFADIAGNYNLKISGGSGRASLNGTYTGDFYILLQDNITGDKVASASKVPVKSAETIIDYYDFEWLSWKGNAIDTSPLKGTWQKGDVTLVIGDHNDYTFVYQGNEKSGIFSATIDAITFYIPVQSGETGIAQAGYTLNGNTLSLTSLPLGKDLLEGINAFGNYTKAP